MTADQKHVLLVDDEEKLLVSISQRLELMGFAPHTATNGKAALEIASQRPIDLAIVDLQMPEMDGLVTITKLKEIRPALKTILLTGHGNEKVRQITESLNTSYFEKDEMGDFWRFIRKLNEEGKVVVIKPRNDQKTTFPENPSTEFEIHTFPEHVGARPQDLPAGLSSPKTPPPPKIIGETPAMQALRKSIERVAALDCAAILRGETGTGKELAARAIHVRSRLCNQRFLAINCGCFNNEQLVEQLLGRKDGSLVGAIQQGTGIFGEGLQGTLLFDHVENMPLHMQIQLLKVIDAIDISSADTTSFKHKDTRILIATGTDLQHLVETGTFRKDLYYRLNLFELNIPPLRKRKDDIPPLCSFFMQNYSREFQQPANTIDREVIDLFLRYDFPGNVRELEHLIERAVIMADGPIIQRKHLPSRFQERLSDKPSPPASETLLTLAEIETSHILNVLSATNGNKSKTAEILGISRAALWRKLKRLEPSSES